MAVNRELKRRIKSIKNISQITKALQLVSAVKTRKAQIALESSAAYKNMLQETMTHLLIDIGEEKVKMLLQNKQKKVDLSLQTAVILISPSRGFAGSLISNLTKKLNELLIKRETHQNFDQEEFLLFTQEHNQLELHTKVNFGLITIDKKGHSIGLKTQKEIIEEYPVYVQPPTFLNIKPITTNILDLYQKGRVGEIFIVYTHFVNSFTQKAVIKQILPFNTNKIFEKIKKENKLSPWYSFSENKLDLFNQMYPVFIETLIFNAMQDAVAAEHSARMVAMKNATDNANDLRKQYTLAYNQQRQASITQEIAEITAASDTV